MFWVVTAVFIIATIIIGNTSIRNIQMVNVEAANVAAGTPGLCVVPANGGPCPAPSINWDDLALFIVCASLSGVSLLVSVVWLFKEHRAKANK